MRKLERVDTDGGLARYHQDDVVRRKGGCVRTQGPRWTAASVAIAFAVESTANAARTVIAERGGPGDATGRQQQQRQHHDAQHARREHSSASHDQRLAFLKITFKSADPRAADRGPAALRVPGAVAALEQTGRRSAAQGMTRPPPPQKEDPAATLRDARISLREYSPIRGASRDRGDGSQVSRNQSWD